MKLNKTPTSPHKPLVHFIGIGGIGISALARWFLALNRKSAVGRLIFDIDLAQKWRISGSDIAPSKITQELTKEGIKVKIGHKKSNLDPKTALVIYNQAIPAQNPELKEAKKRNIPVFSYPEAIGELTKKYKTIAVAGAHGKSTTTAFVALTLIEAGLDPTVIVGTRLKEFGNKNFRYGGDTLVLEADEWKAAFLNYSPAHAIITNLDREHLDFYKNFSNVKKIFLKFIVNIKSDGILIVNKDDKNLFGLKSEIQKIAKRRNLKMYWYSAVTRHSASSRIKSVLKVPGKHNFSNALAAYTLAKNLGIKEKIILKALNQYRGVWRRLEYRGNLKLKTLNPKHYGSKALIYDDYAHHPTEIKASLQALREKYPSSKIICVFQPHQAERLRLLFKDFVNAFDDADNLILLPVYEVPGRDKKNKKFTSEKLAKAITFRNSKLPARRSIGAGREIRNSVIYLPNPKNLPHLIKSILTPKPYPLIPTVIVMMGAGNIVKYTKLLLSSNSKS